MARQMNFIDRIILRKGEKVLLPFRTTESLLKTDLFASYQELLPIIKNCYKEAAQWHGTGRYQYAHANETRYENISPSEHVDVLESIIREGGLRPHHEPFIPKMLSMSLPTISMSPFRVYAKLYAGLYLHEKDSLKYSFGTSKFWFRFLFIIQILNREFLRFIFTKKFFKLVSVSTYRDSQVWIQTIRSTRDTKPFSPFQGYMIRTDITGNYPILIGIKNTVKTISLKDSIGRLESRTLDPILLQDITHIEVPLANVRETEDFLKQKNVAVKVIPLEFGETYCSKCPLSKLIGL